MAINTKSKAPASDAIMAADKMRPLLSLSKKEPVQAAIGLTTDGEGLIFLDKKMKPRKALAQLRTLAGKAKLQLQPSSLRFGRAEVDTELDAAMVRFFINKEAAGTMRPKLIEVVKRSSFQKVEFNVDPSLEEEEDEEDGAEEQATPDAETLKRNLLGLAGRISGLAGADAGRKGLLAKLAGDANVSLKAGNLAETQDLLRQLEAAIDAPAATAPAANGAPVAPKQSPQASPTGAVNYGKCRLLWVGTRKKVETDIGALSKAVKDAYADEGTGDTLADLFSKRVAPIMAGFDESLVDALDDALSATDPAKRATLVAEAREIVGRYQSFLGSETLIAKLDQNTLYPVAIAKTMTAALQALSASLR